MRDLALEASFTPVPRPVDPLDGLQGNNGNVLGISGTQPIQDAVPPMPRGL